jgi:DNA polymerase
VDAIDKDERFLGKTVVLGAGYGTGWLTFQKQLKLKGVTVTDDTAQSIIQTYRETYPRIPLLWKEAGNALDAILDDDKTAPLGTEGALVVEGDKGVRLPNGLYIRYPNLRWENTKGRVEMVYDTKRGRSTIMTRIHGPKMVENVTQALARIIIGDQLLMVARRYRVALTVHDSIVAIAPASEEAKAVEYITNCMRVRPKWAPTLPLSCEAKTGANYG